MSLSAPNKPISTAISAEFVNTRMDALERQVMQLTQAIRAMQESFNRGSLPNPKRETEYVSQFSVFPSAHPVSNGS